MREILIKKRSFILVLLALSFTFARVCFGGETSAAKPASATPEALPSPEPPPNIPTEEALPQGHIMERTPKLEMYPCDMCHSTPKDCNPIKRILTEHTDKGVHFADRKGEEDRWCHVCHKEGDHNKLKLLSGKEITFDETYLMCRQCHYSTYKNWLHDAHGKQTGYWNGLKQIYSCPECHNPHNPPFKPIEAKKPPVRPVHTFWEL